MAKPGRIYLQLDINYHHDAKVAELSPLAELLYIRCLCFCKRLMTDGVLSRGQVWRAGACICDPSDPNGSDLDDLIVELVRVDLLVHADGTRESREFTRDDARESREFSIPNWISWNRSADEIEEISARRSEAGRKGGIQSARSRRQSKQVASDGPSKPEANSKQVGRLLVNTETETETETETDVSRTRRKRQTSAPDKFDITDKMREWAEGNGFGDIDLENQTQLFLDHHGAKGSTYTDWNRAWQTWIRNRATWDKDKAKTAPSVVSGYVPANQMTPEQVEATYAGMPVVGWPE